MQDFEKLWMQKRHEEVRQKSLKEGNVLSNDACPQGHFLDLLTRNASQLCTLCQHTISGYTQFNERHCGLSASWFQTNSTWWLVWKLWVRSELLLYFLLLCMYFSCHYKVQTIVCRSIQLWHTSLSWQWALNFDPLGFSYFTEIVLINGFLTAF